MSWVEFCLGALVFLPLAAAAITAVVPQQAQRVIAGATVLGLLGLLPVLLVHVQNRGTATLALAGFAPPLGIELHADGLAAVFVAASVLVGSIISFHAILDPSSWGVARSRQGFWPLWLGCWAGLQAVFLSGDLFNTYVGLELVGMCAVGLVALGGRGSWSAALRYLYIAVLGSLLFLIGVAVLFSATGTLSWRQIAEVTNPDNAAAPDTMLIVAAVCLMSVGLALKVALFPLHSWLIPAHSSAPGAVSPILSALVIKAALFVILRLWFWVMGPSLHDAGAAGDRADALLAGTVAAWTMGAMGAAAIVWGSILALQQTRLKPLIAYSTVAQIGYWFLVFPVLIDPTSPALEADPSTVLTENSVSVGALAGTVALALGHALAKSGLFLAAGHLKEAYGTDEIDQLKGAGRHHPLLVMAMSLSAVGLIGLPISLSFAGKWQLATSAVAVAQWWVIAVIAIGTLLSAAYMLRAVAPLLLDHRETETGVFSGSEPARGRLAPAHKVSAEQAERKRWAAPEIPAFMLGCATIAAGFLGAWIDSILQVGAPW